MQKEKFKLIESGVSAAGRLEVWREPEPHHHYVAGVDFAFGLESGDFDALVLLREDGEQVAEVHGHWGETFGTALESLLDYFQPFIVGEPTATGLPILRSWFDQGRWLYYHRAESKRGRTPRDQLGHVPGASDITIHWLRRDLRALTEPDPEPPKPATNGKPAPIAKPLRKLVIRSETLHGELCKFRFSPPRGTSIEDSRDNQLAWGAPDGEHDDLVRALALANAGLEWLPKFEKPKPKYTDNMLGKILKLDQLGDEERKSKWR